jgi:hypothetical protein
MCKLLNGCWNVQCNVKLKKLQWSNQNGIITFYSLQRVHIKQQSKIGSTKKTGITVNAQNRKYYTSLMVDMIDKFAMSLKLACPEIN